LTGPITEYDWAEGIALMTIFLMFFIELMAARFDVFGEQAHDLEASHPSRDIMDEREKYNDATIAAQTGKRQIPLSNSRSSSLLERSHDSLTLPPRPFYIMLPGSFPFSALKSIRELVLGADIYSVI
jgi:hypothetical protein